MCLSLIFVSTYCSFFLILAVVYYADSFKVERLKHQEFVSVVIAHRNESDNIGNIIADLLRQDYEYGFEIILVNDHSSDNSQEIINQFKNNLIRPFTLPDDTSGKKAALKLGALQAKGNVLLFTDADCRVGSNWVRLLSASFQNEQTTLVAGPFLYHYPEKGFWPYFQFVEQLFIWGFAKSMARLKLPILCNGANMAVRKMFYLAAADKINQSSPSGDDMFMLNEAKKEGLGAVVFVDYVYVVSRSETIDSFTQMLEQKKRWASKAGLYNDWATNIIGVLALFSFMGWHYLLFYMDIKLLLLKLGVDILLVLNVYSRHFAPYKEKKTNFVFIIKSILTLFLYPTYALLIGIMSKTSNFEWKGRKY